MEIKITGKLVAFLRNLFLHEIIIYLIIKLYKLIVGEQVNKAFGVYSLSQVKDVGVNVKFHGKTVIHDSRNLCIGNNVRIGSGCFFFCMGGLKIGDGTVISRNVTIYTANHDIKGAAVPYDDNYINKSVNIGKAVWIGMNVAITPGVSIGDGAIIGMNTVISKNVFPGETVVGPSQRAVSTRNMEEFNDLVLKQSYFAKKWPDA